MATKYEYFRLAHKLKYTLKRWWILRAFSIPIVTPYNDLTGVNDDNLKTPGYFYYRIDKRAAFINEQGVEELIDDNIFINPLFGVKESISVKANDFLLVKKDTDTFYSNLLLNLLLLEYPFGDSIPFITERFSAKILDNITAKGLSDRSMPIEQYRKYTRVLGFISCLTTIAVPAATPRAIIPPPGIAEMRNKLLEKHKDKLDDPVTVSRIEEELINIYREYIKGDISEGFYLKDKMYTTALKKSHIMIGAEPKLDNPNEVNLATPSLREGWTVNELPQLANSLRMGSYGRGKKTALGGEAAKFSSRIYQNTALAEDDCGTKVGIPTVVNMYNKSSFKGRYKIENGVTSEITGDMPLGSNFLLRSPQTCKTSNGNFCKICMGRDVSEAGLGLGPQASGVGSVFLTESLKLFHVASIVTAKYDYENAID